MTDTTVDVPRRDARSGSAADAAMRRLLRVPEPSPGGRRAAGDVHKAFTTSMLVSATRCLLTYVVLPFVAPLLHLTAVGPLIGIPLGLVAIAANVVSMRRFWLANHKRRWVFTAISSSVIVLVSVLVALDVADLVS